jgi:hypothetical protein
VRKTHIFINNRRHGEIGEALGFGSMFGEFIGLFISRDSFMTWNSSDVDRTPGIDDSPCLGNNKPCQILTRASEVGWAALDCHLRICKDGVTTSWCNLRAELGHCFVDRSEFGIEHLVVPAEIKSLTSLDTSIILPYHPTTNCLIIQS